MTKGEEKFIDQMTRKLMAGWCNIAVLSGGNEFEYTDNTYTQFAVSKKWVNKLGLDRFRILSGGWDVGAAFLKR